MALPKLDQWIIPAQKLGPLRVLEFIDTDHKNLTPWKEGS
jgi:hypothetical protein